LFPVAAAVGVGLGTFSILADGILPGRLFVMLGNIAAPWGLAAFLVGRLTTSLRRGALAGGLALVVGVAVYYLGVALRGYDVGPANAVWTAVALVAGPIMGLSGAATAARPSRPPIAAVVLPAAMLVAEAIFLLVDRKAWRWNLAAEPYRFIELGVDLVLLVGGFLLVHLLVADAHERRLAYLLVAGAGVAGALALFLLYRTIGAVA
jgi:multidrug transporter EmrE-like cation transporter